MNVIDPQTEDNGKYLIVYHREDNDGLFSMALIYQHLIHTLEIPQDNITILGVNHQEKMDIDVDTISKKYSNIIFTDMSLPVDRLKKLYNKIGNRLLWFDHHAPIIKEANENGLSEMPGVRMTDRSAIMCVYDFFYNSFHEDLRLTKDTSKFPELLLVLSAFDSFTFDKWGYTKDYVYDVNTGVNIELERNADKIINYVNDYMNSISDVNSFNEYDAKELDRFFKIGSSYNKVYFSQVAETIRDYGIEFTVDGERTGLGVVCSSFVGSTCFQSVKDKYQNGIIFKRWPSGKWTMSLYNVDDKDTSFNCGEYLKKKYNGGGHIGAAGCEITDEAVMKILKTKKV